jgi:hypothetical protein
MGGGSHQTGGQPDQNGSPGRRHRSRGLRIALCVSLVVGGALAWVAFAGGTQPYETYESRVSADGPVAQFRFDDATGSSKVLDSAGSDTATNNGIVLGSEGPFGGSKSGSFAGEASAALPADPLEGAKEWTAEAWVNWSGGASYKQPVFDFGSSSTNYVYLTPASALTGHKLLLEIHTTGGASTQVTAPKPSANAWHYVAITETSAGTLTLYEEGEQVAQTTGATIFPSSLGSTPTDYLGKSLVSGDPTFKGLLSNVAFYTKVLSASQIETHWNDAEFPVNTALPSISGTAKDGSTLTAKAGSWSGLTPITFAYQWTHCNASGEACTDIPSATESKYTAKSEDVGSTLRAVVTATNGTGAGTATTPATARVEPAAPSNTALPAISGQAKDGQLLSVGNGTWEGTPPLSYSYQWEGCTPERCKKLTGATGSTYRVIGSEIGETLRAAVTAENAAGSKAVKSAQTAVITAGAPVNTSPPTISGEAKDAKTLTGSPGAWAGTGSIFFAYQWQRCDGTGANCTDLAGATSGSYALTASDIGSTIRFLVTGTNTQGSTPAASALTAVVTAIPPANTAPPVISGAAEDGHTLSASTGSWTGSASISYSYQWRRCNSAGTACGDILGATESGYTAGHADVGSTLRVEVTATNAGGAASAGSEATAPVVAQAPANTAAPSISGEARDGQQLSATSGEWSGTPLISFAYQWQRCESDGSECSNISGATEPTYTAIPEDVGHTLRVEVTASNAAGSASETSATSPVVVALAPSDVASPVISGEAKVGQGLTAEVGEWAGTAPLSYSYQWESCDELGEGCLAISGATAPTYTPSAGDAGATLRMVVTARNSAGEADASSLPTALVAGVTECTDTWTGAAGDGLWQTATNWSSGSAPSSSDHACIGPETTVQVTSGSNAVASVKDEGALLIDGGSLEVASAEAPSTVATLTLDGGTLTGVATLHVSQALSLSGNSTISTLTVLLEATASGATVGEECTRLVLDGATLVNEGTFTLAPNSAALGLQGGAQLRNAGTFIDESIDPGCGFGTIGFSIYNAGGESAITNTGTFRADSGSGSTLVVQAPFDDKGAVIAASGTLELSEGGVPEQVATGSWAVEGDGAIVFANGTFLIEEGVDLSHVEITAATVEIAGNGPPVSSTEPDVSGEAEVGRLVSADTGHWTGARPLSYAYQWQRCDSEGEGCTEIEGAIEASYVPSAEDVGHTLRVIVTATNSEGSAARESAPSSIVGFPPVNTAPPSISGTAQDGQTLSATTGTWEGGSTISYSYQWQRCEPEEGGGGGADVAFAGGFVAPFDSSGEGCTDIEGATSPSYTLQDEDVETAVRVVVTAQDADGEASEVSEESETVLPPAAPEPLTAPTISGTAQRGHPLNASQGGWGAVGAVAYAYRWQRCDSAGEGCIDISSATASTYVPGAGDVGHTLRVVVTASNAVGSASNSSMPTAIVSETNCTDTWTGPSTGASWSTGANWSAGHAPGSTDLACIGPDTTIQITSGTNTAGQFEDEGTLTLTGGTLALADSSRPSSVASLSLRNADLAGPGSVSVSRSFSLAANGEMTGSGSLVIEPGAEGVIDASSGCEPMTLSQYTLVNEGVLEYQWGTLDMASGATLENRGTLDYETRSSCHEPQIGLTGEGAQILNDGTFARLASATGGIGVPFNNDGTVEAQAGRLEFSGGGVPEEVATGSWTADGGSIALTAGTFLIGDEVDLSEVEVTGATVVRTSLEAPSVLTPPSISGELTVGKTLSASTGTWQAVPQPSYAYQWERCEAGGEGCSDITGATSQQYELVPDDADATVRVRVTATNTKGSASSTSAATEAIAPAPPVNTTAPAISGTTEDGQTLTASTGVWEASPPLSYTYQWQRCAAGEGSCTNIAGASSSTYTLGHEDVRSDIDVIVTATNPGGSTASSSELTSRIAPAPPADTAPPTLSGEAVAGEAVRANPGTWSGTPPFSYAYEWQVCNAEGGECAAIEGATGRSYTPSGDQVDRRVRVLVTASNDAGAATEHSASELVSDATPPANTRLPAIAGVARDGQTLTADPGAWEGTNASFVYQWQSCNPEGGECHDIEGETGETYTLGAGDIGSTIRIVVEASNPSGSAEATSAATAEVSAGPPNELDAPSVTGITAVGETLAAHSGEWGGTETSTEVQWESCSAQGTECEAITGATGLEYQLGEGDLGTTLRVRVQASNEQATVSAVSVTTDLVGTHPATLLNTLAPTITGTAQVGGDLTVDAGSWADEEEISYAYQWQSCDPSGSDCHALAGATGETLSVGSDAMGDTLLALVTASDANGSQTLTTPVTATVGAEGAPELQEPPSVYGAAIEGQTLDGTTGEWSAEGAQIAYGYQWQRCAVDGTSCEPIAGATSSAYVLQGADGGHTLRLLVSADDAYGEVSAMSSPTAIVAPTELTMLVGPSISGPAETGHVLTAETGIWTALGPVAYGYQWERCDESGEGCATIAGATAARYTPTATDLGHALKVEVTAVNGGDEVIAPSTATAAVVTPETAPENTVAPTVEGIFTVGETLVASPGLWAGAEPITYAYQWQSCAPGGQECADIEGANESTYVLATGDAGSRIRVLVTATNELAGTGASSEAGEAVGAPGPPSVSESEGPSIYGTAKPKGVLFVSNGAWTGSRPLEFHYQWQRCNAAGEACAQIEGATRPSYEAQSGDVGSTIRVEVSVSNALDSTTATSAPVVVTATGQTDAGQAIELAQATDPSILAPATSATVEGQELKPALADSGQQLDSESTLTGSALSKQSTGEFELDTPAGELGLEARNAEVGAATLPTLVNGVAAVYAGSATATDTIVRPEPLGVASLLQLHSSASPTSFSWRVHIGPSQTLEQLSNGSVAVIEAEEEEPEGGEPSFASARAAGGGSAHDMSLASPFDAGAEEGFDGGAAEREHDETVSKEGSEGELPAAPTVDTASSSPQSGELHPQDTEHEYDAASEAVTQAETSAGGTVVMVIQAPTVLDASGAVVPSSLSADGESVTLTLAPAEGVTYPVTAETAVAAPGGTVAPQLRAFALAPAAAKSGARYYGLGSSYNAPEDFATSEDSPGHFDSRIGLHGKGKLHASFARAFVQYNLKQTNPQKWGELLQWLSIVGANGLKPLLTFESGTGEFFCKTEAECIKARGTPETYGADLKEEIEALKDGTPEVPATAEKPAVPAIPPVHYFGAWNEPNLNGKEKFAYYNDPAGAAMAWRTAEAAMQASGCTGCYMLAGEFTNYVKEYISTYKKVIVKEAAAPVTIAGKAYKPGKPVIWSMHDYQDIVYYPERQENRNATEMIAALKGMNAKLWLTELGVNLEGNPAGAFTSLYTGKYHGHTIKYRVKGKQKSKTPNQLQIEAANDFLRLGTLPHVEMLSYYQYKAHGGSFDDGLLNPGTNQKEPKNWREAYCVLALDKHTGCPAKVIKVVPLSKSAHTAKVAMNVDPSGLPTEYWVVFGTTTSYGQATPHVELRNESGEQTVTTQLSGLTPCTTYHYRVQAENEGNEGVPSEGADQTFETPCEDHAVVEDSACEANVLSANDDQSTGRISLPFTIDYYGRDFSSLFVNNNGNVTFDEPLGQWTPYVLEASSERPIMAPFMGDVDTRGGGSQPETGGGGGGGSPTIVRGASRFLTASIPSEIEGGESGVTTYGATRFAGHSAFCVDWPYVGYWREHTDRLNDFQLMIVDRNDIGAGDFEIMFNYDQVKWETGDFNGGHDGLGGESAAVGYSNGDGSQAHSFELAGSRENGALLDSDPSGLIHGSRNSEVLGRYVFDVFPN